MSIVFRSFLLSLANIKGSLVFSIRTGINNCAIVEKRNEFVFHGKLKFAVSLIIEKKKQKKRM